MVSGVGDIIVLELSWLLCFIFSCVGPLSFECLLFPPCSLSFVDGAEDVDRVLWILDRGERIDDAVSIQ